MTEILFFIAIITIICTLSSRISHRFGIPSLLIFIALGMIFGSDGIFRIDFANYQLTEKISTISLIFIMFYGGFCMNWKMVKPVAGKACLLSSIGIITTCFLVGFFAHIILGTGIEGYLLGAVLASTDAASVFSILRMKKLNLKHGIAPLIEMESGSNDPFAYMLTVLILQIMAPSAISLPKLIIAQIGFGLGCGFLIGYLGSFIFKNLRFKDTGMQIILLAGIALLAYTLPTLLSGNGFLSVYIAAIVMGNHTMDHKVEVVAFFDSISSLMQICLFFLLGLLAFPSQIPEIMLPAFLIFIILTCIARPLSVALLLTPFGVPWKEQLFISWCGLRGAASIVFAILTVVSPAYMNNDIFHIVFFVSLLSITLQGSFLPHIAHILDIEDESNNTMLTFNDYRDENSPILIETHITKEHPWINKQLSEVIMPTGMLVVMIKRKNEKILPEGSTIILADDILVMCSPIYYDDTEIPLEEIIIDAQHIWLNKQLHEVNKKNDFLIIMIKRDQKTMVPKGDTQILLHDRLLLCQKDLL